MFHVPENNRDTKSPFLKSDRSYGNNGFFIIPHYRISGYTLNVQASDGEGWEHISVTVAGNRGVTRNPTWEEMCYLKDLFWDEQDCVIQYHPAKSEYISCPPYCLHLWKPTDQTIPTPPKEFVGPASHLK